MGGLKRGYRIGLHVKKMRLQGYILNFTCNLTCNLLFPLFFYYLLTIGYKLQVYIRKGVEKSVLIKTIG